MAQRDRQSVKFKHAFSANLRNFTPSRKRTYTVYMYMYMYLEFHAGVFFLEMNV